MESSPREPFRAASLPTPCSFQTDKDSHVLELLLGLAGFLLLDWQSVAGAGLNPAFPPWPAYQARSVKDRRTKMGLF